MSLLCVQAFHYDTNNVCESDNRTIRDLVFSIGHGNRKSVTQFDLMKLIIGKLGSGIRSANELEGKPVSVLHRADIKRTHLRPATDNANNQAT